MFLPNVSVLFQISIVTDIQANIEYQMLCKYIHICIVVFGIHCKRDLRNQNLDCIPTRTSSKAAKGSKIRCKSRRHLSLTRV